MSFTWETLTLTALAYLATLPFGARAWTRKYGKASRSRDAHEAAPPTAPLKRATVTRRDPGPRPVGSKTMRRRPG